MFFVSIAAVILLPLLGIAQNPKGAGRTLVGTGIVLVVIGISYVMADTTPIVTPSMTFDNPIELRLSDTGLYATYIAFAGAIAAIVIGELVKLFRK